ncbi:MULTISPECIES: DUF6105 family protein [Sinorhizobium/Ensifer group]|uniref:DUF6105 family protein n=1 Tax=Sinorhizobium/Ensifer group TaxID=227292 RepID=UPI00071D600D|nr:MULTISPECIES: DUF6105 family protein [Sinorhizobium/Ensifer group]KSV63564.1 hypothetical protein N183_07490 [Sinorhizobium sp. Sb3]KSV93885.1 hypothetical protein N184_19470 [Sinorhizobium sp. GL28]MBD9506442.1 hypothetical protein [Ensifer sp. ENS10]
MKWFLILWACPVMFLTSWYGLSYYDMSFGFFMLTRQTHDLVFQVYGNVLGIPPETIPPLVARAIVFDSFVVFAIIGFRKRREIAAWYRRRFGAGVAQSERPSLASEASLSSAP